MNIFLTGGAGYIGSTTAEILIQAGHTVTIYDSLVTGHKAAVPAKAEFIQADLAEISTLSKALQHNKFDAVMHFAASIEAGESMQNPGKFFQNNVINSLNLIECVHLAGINRFVLSSTAAIYDTSEKPLTEKSKINPQNVYGQTKLIIEQTLQWYFKVYGLRYAALRYFNAAGAMPHRGEAHQPETHLLPLVLRVALGQLPEIKIFGTDYETPDGTAIRDYIHVADLASAHLLALEALESMDYLEYNLGNGQGYSVKEVVEAAREVTSHPIPALDSPRRSGDPTRLVASSKKILHDLGWEPQISGLKEIITSAWDWHRKHPNGYDNSSK